MSSTQIGQVASLRETKRRLNLPDTVSKSDAKIQDFMQEADNYVNIQVSPHTAIPIENPGPELVSLASSLAATMFNYWQTPIKERNIDGIKEWKKFVADQINAVYSKKSESGFDGASLYEKTTGLYV